MMASTPDYRLETSRREGLEWDRRMLCVIHTQSYGAPGVCDCSVCRELARGAE